MKKRTSKRSALLYSRLLFLGFKKEELALNWENTYYGIALTNRLDVFIHKHKAKFSVENNEWYSKPDLNRMVQTSKITDKSLNIILALLNEKV